MQWNFVCWILTLSGFSSWLIFLGEISFHGWCVSAAPVLCDLAWSGFHFYPHYPLILLLVSCFCVSLVFPSLWQSVSDLWPLSWASHCAESPGSSSGSAPVLSWFCLRGSTVCAILQPFLYLPSSITLWCCPSCSRDCASCSVGAPQITGTWRSPIYLDEMFSWDTCPAARGV